MFHFFKSICIFNIDYVTILQCVTNILVPLILLHSSQWLLYLIYRARTYFFTIFSFSCQYIDKLYRNIVFILWCMLLRLVSLNHTRFQGQYNAWMTDAINRFSLSLLLEHMPFGFFLYVRYVFPILIIVIVHSVGNFAWFRLNPMR